MALVDSLYAWLSEGPTPDCDRILASGLEHAEPAYAERIRRVLLERHNAAAWSVLVGLYGELPAAEIAQLRQDSALLREAIAGACRAPLAHARLNALRALEANLSPRMSYLLPDAMLDRSTESRVLAGKLLKRMAEQVLDAADSSANRCDEQPDEVPVSGETPVELTTESSRPAVDATQRRLFVASLWEALRSFDGNHRLEVLEVSLWFARDLGRRLWDRLNSLRSRAGVIIADHIWAWNDRRLAGFLLLALRDPSWRSTALKMLRGWQDLDHATELLRHTSLLSDPQIAHQLGLFRSVPWFVASDRSIRSFPSHLRHHIPRWISVLGYPEAQKLSILVRWAREDDAGVQRGAMYALATLETPEVISEFGRLSESQSPLARFARWYLRGRESRLLKRAARAASSPERAAEAAAADPAVNGSPPAEAAATVLHDAGDSTENFDLLWQTCRRAEAQERSALVEAVRDHADHWREPLVAQLRSSDPRNRLLALQVISTANLARAFGSDLLPLQRDPVSSIARLTQSLLANLASAAPGDAASEPDAQLDAAQENPELNPIDARCELRTLLQQLSSGASRPTDQTVGRLRTLLRAACATPHSPRPEALAS